MKRILLSVALGLLGIGLFFSPAVMAAEKSPCADDVAKYCPGIKPGFGAMMDCLEKNESKLSPACREHEKTMGGKRMEASENVRDKRKFRQNCGADMQKFCAKAEPGRGSGLKCLKEHKAQLSPACSESLNEMDSMKGQPQKK